MVFSFGDKALQGVCLPAGLPERAAVAARGRFYKALHFQRLMSPLSQPFSRGGLFCAGMLLAPFSVQETFSRRRRQMGNASKRAAGAAKELHGKVKKTVGKLVGSERLAAEGRARELAGRGEKESAKGRERVKGAVEEVSGRVQSAAGDLVDDSGMSARGQLRKAKGKARQAANR